VSATSIGDAYSRTGSAWSDGPATIYDRLSEVMAAMLPTSLSGARVLDLGAGTGAAGRAAVGLGAGRVVALDAAIGLLEVDRRSRPPAVVGDALALPFADACFDAVLAAFSFNHLVRPSAAFVEAARVLAAGGSMAVSAYADDDTHPVKQAVDAACADHGWQRPEWYLRMQAEAAPKLATPERALVEAAGLPGAEARRVAVDFAGLAPEQLIAWRLGMAQVAPFLSTLPDAERATIAAEARSRLGDDPPPLVRRMIVVTWTRP
jgi:SAM-dependent methyltransferase